MRYLISTICIALFLWGCDNAAAVPDKPIVVRKKIAAKKVRTAKVRKQKAVRTAKAKPVAKKQTRTIAAKPDKTRPTSNNQPPVKQDTSSQPRIAKKAKTAPVQSSPPSRLKQKKPAIRPKSDITEIKPVRQKGGKAVAGKKSKSSKLLTASIDLPGGVPARYDPKGKVDPFDPLIKDREAVAKKGKKIKRAPRTPLERIDLGQLKLVGIILAGSGNRALVEESSGKGYVVKNGTYIGTNGGKIINIQKEKIYIEEKFEDIYGKIQTRKRELKLPKPPGEF
ncbi:hypothetical protein D1AOALGA4SA_10854 [Olavius algarvensis Delta 1 endosymbiont]|nr:hypothetical protein D1AOALGA4SA_10854 [Olavius algarvensis Delta 1 endosymbiont]